MDAAVPQGDRSQTERVRTACSEMSARRPRDKVGLMLTVYGRKSSFNVQKVMWLIGELGSCINTSN